MIGLFKKKSLENKLPVDVHSHLLPAIDDGVQSLEEAIEVIRGLAGLGYKKIITTPHINSEFYPNTPQIIKEKLSIVQEALTSQSIPVELFAAAEYFLDESLVEKMENGDHLLTFGDNYLLFECSFLNEPMYLKEFIFSALSKGYKPILAHPERYAFVHNNPDTIEDLKNRGVMLQVNMMSLTGHYNKIAKKVADRMIKNGQVDLLGSDCHNKHHLDVIRASINSKSFQKALDLPLLNYKL